MSASPESLGRRLDRWLGTFEDFLMFVCLGAAAVLGMLQVVLRYVFATGIFWIQGVLIMLVIYAALVGASVAVRRRLHVQLDVVVERLPSAPRWGVCLAGVLLSFVFVLALWYFGFLYVLQVVRYEEINNETELPEWIHYAAVPLGMGLAAVRFVQEMWRLLREGPGADARLEGRGTGV